MELESFLNDIQIDDTGFKSNTVPRSAFLYMIEHNSQAVRIVIERTFVINNTAMLEKTKDGYFIYDVPLTSSVDIACDFQSNVRFDLLLADVVYSGNNKVVVTNSQYCEKKVRLYIYPNNTPEHLELSYTGILLGTDKRRELAQTPRVWSGELQYYNGMVFCR